MEGYQAFPNAPPGGMLYKPKVQVQTEDDHITVTAKYDSSMLDHREKILVQQYGDRLYECPHTGKRFTQSHHLDAHMSRWREQQRLKDANLFNEIPKGNMDTYEVYGDRVGMHPGTKEMAKLKQRSVRERFTSIRDRRSGNLKFEVDRQHAFHEFQRRKETSKRLAAQKLQLELDAKWQYEENKQLGYTALNEELHERIQIQDYRAIVWRQQKMAAEAKADDVRAIVKAEEDSKNADMWKKKAIDNENHYGALAAAQKQRADMLEREDRKDELKDLRKKARHLEASYKRARDKRNKALQRKDDELKSEERERQEMKAQEGEMRQFMMEEWEMLNQKKQLERRRQRKRRPEKKPEPEVDFSAQIELTKKRRLWAKYIAMMETAWEHKKEMEGQLGCRGAWMKWQNTVRLSKLKDLMSRWLKRQKMGGRDRAWELWKMMLWRVKEEEYKRLQDALSMKRTEHLRYMNSFHTAASQTNVNFVSSYQWDKENKKKEVHSQSATDLTQFGQRPGRNRRGLGEDTGAGRRFSESCTDQRFQLDKQPSRARAKRRPRPRQGGSLEDRIAQRVAASQSR
jgi:hypothetical protein